MIGYGISRASLEARIEKKAPGWLKRAEDRTKVFRQLGRYKEKGSIWSEVKAVYMRLQGGAKCAYCERKLEAVDLGKGEQDVEHFRPKSSVKNWKVPKQFAAHGFAFTPAPPPGQGYHLLPYHPLNYCAACKPCNSVLKRDCFPIAGAYELNGGEPALLTSEKPYLIFPVGDFDEPPEKLIKFHGISPQPVATDGHRRARALVTIEFFKLDSVTKRKNLVRERAVIITALFPLLRLADSGLADEKQEAKQLIGSYTSPKAPHTNCAASFRSLYEADPDDARVVYKKAVRAVDRMS